jgi:hypothetical protein
MPPMSAFASDPFAAPPLHSVPIDVYTTAYRVSGVHATRFTRVGDIVNQLSSTHMLIDQATVSEYDNPSATLGAHQVLVTLDEILFVIATEAEAGQAQPEMRIPKRPVQAQVGLPPFRLTGSVHVVAGSRPVDGLLNASDRFLPMTNVTISSGAHPELGRTAGALALQRSLAHLIMITEDGPPDELLADVLDERTAERWLQPGPEREPPG